MDERLRSEQRDELGDPITPERIAVLRSHFSVYSDTWSREVGLILDTLTADLAAARAREAALQAVARVVGYMEDAPELWGNPAATTAISRLQRALAAARPAEEDDAR